MFFNKTKIVDVLPFRHVLHLLFLTRLHFIYKINMYVLHVLCIDEDILLVLIMQLLQTNCLVY